jgi:AraC-like DNA-binding protein
MTAKKARARSYGLSEDLAPFDTGWHRHRQHQVLFAAAGIMHLTIDDAQWLLPPERAAWLPAGTRHAVRARVRVALRTIYLDPSLARDAPAKPCVFAVAPLAREMLLYATRWGPERDSLDAAAEPFFETFAALVARWAAADVAYRLPTARSPVLERAMRYALNRLADNLSFEEAAREARVSTRTLARRFESEAKTTWRDFVHTARMLRAMDLLGIEGKGVTETAFAVGFASPGAFTHAFTKFAGKTPTRFRSEVGSAVVTPAESSELSGAHLGRGHRS